MFKSLSWPSRAPSTDQFFSVQRPQVKVARCPWTLLIFLQNSAKTSLCFSCFPDVVSVGNGSHMLNANTISSTSAPSGSCDAAPLAHTHTPPTNLWCPVFCFPRCLIICTEHSFVFMCAVSLFCPFFFCLQLFCQSGSLTLQACCDCLMHTEICFSLLPDVHCTAELILWE